MTQPLKAVPGRTLPRRALPTDTVDIDGEAVEVRALTRSEALHLSTAFNNDGVADADGAEVYILMQGAGVTEGEAKAFREENDITTAGLVIDRILELSSLAEVDGKDPKPDGSEAS